MKINKISHKNIRGLEIKMKPSEVFSEKFKEVIKEIALYHLFIDFSSCIIHKQEADSQRVFKNIEEQTEEIVTSAVSSMITNIVDEIFSDPDSLIDSMQEIIGGDDNE